MKLRIVNKLWRKLLTTGERPRNCPDLARVGLRNTFRRIKRMSDDKGWEGRDLSDAKQFQEALKYFLRQC